MCNIILPLGPGGQIYTAFFVVDDFALMSWLIKPYSRRQLTREERVSNYRISSGRRVVKNAFGILVGRFKMLLTTMGQRPKVVRGIVNMCGITSHAEKSSGEETGHQHQQKTYKHHRMTGGAGTEFKLQKSIEGGQTSMRPTERLLQQLWGTVRRLGEEQAVIYQSF